jgi:hypothetical protein
MKLCALVAGFVLIGCGTDDIVVELDSTLSSADQSEVRRAGGTWDGVTDSKVRFSDRGDWLVIRADVPDGFYGYTEPDRRLIRIKADVPTDTIYVVAIHELGHALKLEHTCVSPDPRMTKAAPGAPLCGNTSHGVMDPIHARAEMGWEDLRECRRVGACD